MDVLTYVIGSNQVPSTDELRAAMHHIHVGTLRSDDTFRASSKHLVLPSILLDIRLMVALLKDYYGE